MLRRLLLIVALAFIPTTAALALVPAPLQDAPYNVPGAIIDQVQRTTLTGQQNRIQGINAYNMSFHNDTYQYMLPMCVEPTLVEQDGRKIDPTSFVIGDTVVATVRPNAIGTAKACVNRVVRQKISRGSSGGECLQEFQVKHEVEGTPERLITKTEEYNYILRVYARPSLDCDGKAYGSSPITTVVAPGKQFIVTLERETPSGNKELMRRSLTTNADGRANFLYTFTAPGDNYKFSVKPATNGVAGDVITWIDKVIDPNPTPEPTPEAVATASDKLPIALLIGVLVVVLVLAIGAEYWHWMKKRRDRESPEDEYQRITKL